MADEIHWWSARRLATAIADGRVRSREALEHFVARIESLDAQVNAVVHWDLDQARAAADAADAAVAAGQPLGPLHGVPITIKDSFQTRGCITTSGAPELADFVPDHDAWPVARLREAGAVPFAKTNLPIWAGDIQSHNEVYGCTNNPFDLSRTPGGSSGGSSAALAMGFTPLELGSDIGGSIRVPAHYSGVVGHKPTYGIVPAHGQIPGMPGTLSQADLAVAGPMARHVDDLELAMDVLVGPDRWHEAAVSIDLPPSRHRELADFRIAAWLDDDYCRVDADTARVLGALVETIEHAGGRVDIDARPGFTLEKVDTVFSRLLQAALSGGHDRPKIEHMAATADDTPIGRIKAATSMRHRDWLADNERRLQIRERWRAFFADHDVMLLPVHPRPAIPHDHSPDQWERTVEVDGVEYPYGHLFRWTGPAGAALLPATVVPVGMSADGLPIGVQIVAPFLEDRTGLRVAAIIEELVGGCPRPALAV